MFAKFGKDVQGQYVILKNGEMLYSVKGSPFYDPKDRFTFRSGNVLKAGWNNGAGSVELGTGETIITNCRSLWEQIVEQLEIKNLSAFVPHYNSVLWYDTADKRISKMVLACGGCI